MKMCLDVQTGVGRPHRIQRHRGGDTTQNQSRLLAVWLACSMIIVPMPILAPSCKLKLARFSAKLRIQDGAECGKN